MSPKLVDIVERAYSTGWQYLLGFGAGTSAPLVIPGLPSQWGPALGVLAAVLASVLKNLSVNTTSVVHVADQVKAVVDSADETVHQVESGPLSFPPVK